QVPLPFAVNVARARLGESCEWKRHENRLMPPAPGGGLLVDLPVASPPTHAPGEKGAASVAWESHTRNSRRQPRQRTPQKQPSRACAPRVVPGAMTHRICSNTK